TQLLCADLHHPRPPSGPPPPRLPAPRRPARAAAARAVDQLTQLVANRARGARPGSDPGPALGGDVGRESPEAARSTRPRPTRATVPGPERVAGVWDVRARRIPRRSCARGRQSRSARRAWAL